MRFGRESANLSGLVLCDLVLGVFLAGFTLAVGAAGLRNVDLMERFVSIPSVHDTPQHGVSIRLSVRLLVKIS